jgi:phosphate/phosphite/phosphonate ABC transporter binding protein
VHIASYGSASFARALITGVKIDAFGIDVNADGSKGYYSVFYVKKDSPYQKIEDLKGKPVAFVDPNSTSGNNVPRFEMNKLGLDPEKGIEKIKVEGSKQDAVWNQLKMVFDPEIPVNVVDLGLIYDCQLTTQDDGKSTVLVKMTLTAPGCGMGPTIAADAKSKIESLAGVESAEVVIVWDPIWTPQMISPEGRKTLGLE